MITQNDVGAVVLGGDYQGLGIVRSLGRHGIPVCVIDDERSISRHSRYTTHAVRVDSLRDQDRSVELLVDIGNRLHLDGWVLYPTREETVAAISRHRVRLREQFRVPTPGWETVRWAWDKRNTYELAEQLRIPIPRTWYPRDLTDLRDIATALPVAIKPAIKEHFLYPTKAKAWKAETTAELEVLFQRARTIVGPGEIMVQEFIPGAGAQQFAFCAFFKDGRAVGQMTVQRLRQHPPEFGRASTFVETTDVPVLETLSQRLLKSIDYYGLAELEFKLDPRDGEYKLLDFNARTWGYHSLGWQAGVDFPYLLFADQVGRAPDPCRARVGVRWIRMLTDLPTALTAIVKGELEWRSYVQSMQRPHAEAVFSKDDPIPGLVEVALLPYLSVKRGF